MRCPLFLVRQSNLEDTGTLLTLARMVYFINLPPDEGLIAARIQHSRNCFRKALETSPGRRAPDKGHDGGRAGYAVTQEDSDLLMFSMEDTESGGVIGTSQIRAHMGGPGNPNYAFKVFRREFRSESLGLGTTHLVARLHKDESSPSEIGGLILQPSFRGHPARPGRLLSLVRFHFMALHRAMFADRVIAEMMPQISSDGDNLFWDHIGRKFIPVKYAEADRFCQHNRRFIDELLPKEDLYLSLLPLEVLNGVAQVGKETVPARRMLERVGFTYKNLIDPFDGGPNLEAQTDEIPIVRDTRSGALGEPLPAGKATHRGFVSTLQDDGQFRALETEYAVDGHGRLRIPGAAMELLHARQGATAGYTPMDKAAPAAGQPPERRSSERKPVAGKKRVRA